jgi:hypothetical protein
MTIWTTTPAGTSTSTCASVTRLGTLVWKP